MKDLVQAVIKVMKEVKGMEKNSQVGSGTMAYNGTKDQDVKEVFNEALYNNGLCMLPMNIEESTELSRWEETNKYGTKQKQSIFTKVTVKYLLCHESGQSQVICGYGHGVDSQDKGAGKATTYAMKNALLYTFMTPVGKIDDADTTHSNEIQVPSRKPALTTEQFEKTLQADAKGIKAVLDRFRMSDDQRKQLNSKL